MQVSDWIAGASFGLSVWAFYKANKVNKLDIAIKKLQLASAEKENRVKSDLFAEVLCIDSTHYDLVISNVGNIDVYNVSVKSNEEKSNVGIFDNDLPFCSLLEGQSFSIHLFVCDQSSHVFEIEMSWEDKDGTTHEKTMTLSL